MNDRPKAMIVRVRKQGKTYRLTMHAPEGISEPEFRAHASTIAEGTMLGPERSWWTGDVPRPTAKVKWFASGQTGEAAIQALNSMKSRITAWMNSRGYAVEFIENISDEPNEGDEADE